MATISAVSLAAATTAAVTLSGGSAAATPGHAGSGRRAAAAIAGRLHKNELTAASFTTVAREVASAQPTTARHGTAKHGTAKHSTARHGTARHTAARHTVVKHRTTTARHVSSGHASHASTSSRPVSHVSTVSGSPRHIAAALLGSYGWSGGQFSCLDSLWNRESGWNIHAYNAGSGAYGIPQALPGAKMASMGPDWQNSALTQIKWGLSYIKGRYGSPCGAWYHEETSGWY